MQEPSQEVPPLLARIGTLLESADSRAPLLPKVALQVMELARRKDVELAEVVALVESDPVLAGKLLSLCGSVYYVGVERVRSLRQAVVRLGLNVLHNLMVEIALNVSVFVSRQFAPAMERVRLHSVLSAHGARLVCLHTGLESGSAYLGALVHDVGVALSLVTLANHEPQTPPSLRDWWPVIADVHERAAVRLANAWRLPADIERVVGHHHLAPDAADPTELAAAVLAGEYLAQQLGAGVLSETDRALLPPETVDRLEVTDEAFEQAAGVLGLDGPRLVALSNAAAEMYERLRGGGVL